MAGRYIAFGAAIVAVSASAGELPKEHRKNYAFVAEVISSGETCSRSGFEVDFNGLNTLREEAIAGAVQSGVSSEEAENELNGRIEREYAVLEGRYKRAEIMSHSRNHVERYRYFWKKRCEDLAKDERSAPYFVDAQ